MMQDDNTNQDIGDDESEDESQDTRETTLSSDIEEDRFGLPAPGPSSRPGTPGQVITNYKGSIAKETEPC
jgi:hypothetical protein